MTYEPLHTSRIGAEELKTIVQNSAAVLISSPEQREDWIRVLEHSNQEMHGSDENKQSSDEAVFLSILTRHLRGESVALPVENAYHPYFKEILRRVLAGNPFADGELPLSQVNQICANTTMIILTVHAQADEWRQQIIQFRQNAIDANFPHDQAFFDAVLAVLAGQEVSLPEHPLYRAAITEMQENIKSGDQPAVISSEQLDTIVQRTVQAVHGSEHDRSVWHDVIQDALRKARSLKQSKDADFFENLLRVLGGGKPNLPKDHPYRDALQRVIVGIRVGLPVSTESLPAEQLKRIAANTVLVMKDHPEEWDAWHEMISDVLRQAREAQLGKDAAFFQAILNLLEHKEVSLDEQNPYHPILHAIQQALKD